MSRSPCRVARLVFAALALATVLIAPAARAAALTLSFTPAAVSLPVAVADRQGFFKAEGVDVRVVACVSGPACLRSLIAKQAQMTTVTEISVVMASFERSDFAVIASMARATGNIRLLARKSAGIASPADLRHKRVGVVVGTSPHYYLDAFLLFHGIDPEDLDLVPLSADDIAPALGRQQVDVVAVFNRQAGAVAKVLQHDLLVFDDPRIYTETYNLLVDREVLAARRDDAVKVLRALQRAERFIAEQPRQAAQILRDWPGFDPASAAVYTASVTYRLALDHSLLTSMDGQARWALRKGRFASDSQLPNYLEFVDGGPLRQALSGPSSR